MVGLIEPHVLAASSNRIFNNTGSYFYTTVTSPKSKWRLNDFWTSHYETKIESFHIGLQHYGVGMKTANLSHFSTQVVDETLFWETSLASLKGASMLLTGVYSPYQSALKSDYHLVVVHIFNYILEPSAQVFGPEIPDVQQSFIATSCADVVPASYIDPEPIVSAYASNI